VSSGHVKSLTLAAYAALLAMSGVSAASWAQSGRPARPPAYLDDAALPDSAAFLPPPPSPGSAALARDEAAMRSAQRLRGGARWAIARVDADLRSDAATAVYSCAAGFAIGPRQTPALDRLLRRAMSDFANASRAAKRKYARARPFMVNGQPTCTPENDVQLRQDGSYPSGHSAIGHGSALILTWLVPDRKAAILARGDAFGDSRRICNAHWRSDIEAGRTVAEATVRRLQDNAAFKADLAAARREVEAARKGAGAPGRDCAVEQRALATAG
jgi:acid phosphatase (class A)